MEEAAHLCVEVRNEADLKRTEELLRQLREILAVQQEEARLRISALAKHYHVNVHNASFGARV